MALHVLRKIKRDTIRELHDPITPANPRATGADFLYVDKNKEWFAQGYVDADYPARSAEISKAIMDGTTEFVLWSDGEGAVGTYKDYFSADFALRNAKMSYTTQIEVPPEVSDEPPAPAARKGKAADAVESGAAAS
jgi:hypothetical protein